MRAFSTWIVYAGLAIGLMALPACGGKNDAVTQEFRHYCQSTFSWQPENGRIYCLLPSNQCRNCILYNGQLLPPAIKSRLVMISCFPASDYKNFDKVYYDKDQKMMELVLLDYSSRLIVYETDAVRANIPLHDFYKQLDSLSKTLPSN